MTEHEVGATYSMLHDTYQQTVSQLLTKDDSTLGEGTNQFIPIRSSTPVPGAQVALPLHSASENGIVYLYKSTLF